MIGAILTIVLALTRAEIVERMRAPIVTQADGLVKVFSNCSEARRREFQTPIARFAAETVKNLYAALKMKPIRFAEPGILVFLGNAETNVLKSVTRVETNGTRIVSRIVVANPGSVDLDYFRSEIAVAFFRAVKHEERERLAALAVARRADPRLRVADERAKLELWLEGRTQDDDEGFRLLRKIIEPGVASRRDVLTFASRLHLYPRYFDEKFVGGIDVLSFSDAIKFAKIDPRVRILAFVKSNEITVWGGGRSESLAEAAEAYRIFLRALAEGEASEADLEKLLRAADQKLKTAMEKAQ